MDGGRAANSVPALTRSPTPIRFPPQAGEEQPVSAAEYFRDAAADSTFPYALAFSAAMAFSSFSSRQRRMVGM